MFATVTQLGQLAFQGLLNSLYTILLLGASGVVAVQWWSYRKRQEQWKDQWDAFEDHCHTRLETLLDEEDDLLGALDAHHGADLAAHLKVHNTPPPPEWSSDRMLRSALESHPLLTQHPIQPERWERLPGVAVLLGLLGTFLGLTGALTQLPLAGGLKKLTDGLQFVLPLMGTAFWTSVCGLLASLVLRALHHVAKGYQSQRTVAYDRLAAQLTARIGRELYPHLAHHGQVKAAPEGGFQIEPLLELWREQQLIVQEHLTEQFGLLRQEVLEQLRSHQQPTASLEGLRETLEQTQSSLGHWSQSLREHTAEVHQATHALSNAVNPIAHTEQLLQERVAGLTRQHEALTTLLETLLEYEKQLPDKLRDLLTGTLRPAHRVLQRSNQSLQQTLELLMDRNAQEREAWRQELHQLTERFQALERLMQDSGNQTRELTQITQHLAEIAEHLRFRPRPVVEAEPSENYESLDNEIDQLLDGLGHRNPNEPSS